MNYPTTRYILLLLIAPCLLWGDRKVDKNVSYGPHERNVIDVYWDSTFKNAPIVFTIHGGGFKNGSKAYCDADTQKLYLDKGCVVVSPNYRLIKHGNGVGIKECEIDCAMAVAYIQANAKKYGGDPQRIIVTGGSAGGYLSARLAYRDSWDWPEDAAHKPKKLHVVGWYGDSPYLPPYAIKSVGKNDPPGFIIYGQREHPATPASQGHDMQAQLKKQGVWNQMVYVKQAGHVPGKQVLINTRSRNAEVHKAFDAFLDMVCHQKGEPAGGNVITISRK